MPKFAEQVTINDGNELALAVVASPADRLGAGISLNVVGQLAGHGWELVAPASEQGIQLDLRADGQPVVTFRFFGQPAQASMRLGGNTVDNAMLNVSGTNSSGTLTGNAIVGRTDQGVGVQGISKTGAGVQGANETASGLIAGHEPFGNNPVGVFGRSNLVGVLGFSDSPSASGIGVGGNTNGGSGTGVHGHTSTGIGVLGSSDGPGLAAKFIGRMFHDGEHECTKTMKAFDLFLAGGDCAEDFEVADRRAAFPGTVMVFDDEGMLTPNTKPYDKRVAGIVSGAGEYRPGIVLNRQETNRGGVPIALVGRAYCRVDACYGRIEVGDLLTTSATVGCAMKASDPERAFGSVLGKALRPWRTGEGLIPILIALG
jgi:hypothetical protein